jgi:hypothetical protein
MVEERGRLGLGKRDTKFWSPNRDTRDKNGNN